jgi:uncharacterized membrane protein
MHNALLPLVAASASFLGSHFVLSHPLRKSLVKALGAQGFLAAYSIVAAATLAWMIVAFRHAPVEPMLWNGMADLPWIAASVLAFVAMALFVASLIGNPALPQANVAGLSARPPKGVFRITRHPMMWGFALWALAHMLVAPTPRTLVLAGTIFVLALGGAWLQDRKKEALSGREWKTWVSRTRFVPGLSGWGGLGWMWLVAAIVYMLATLAHVWFADVPAGPWKWVDLSAM